MMTAVYLNEVGGRMRRPVRIFVDTMSGVPSIVAGLFIFTVLVEGHGFSGFSAALALSILMLPTVTRTAEVVLRLVPDGLREASLALGSPQWRTVWGVVMPSARSGLITAAILGVARVVGETAPLIMTAFGSRDHEHEPVQGRAGGTAPGRVPAFQLSSQNSDVERAWLYAPGAADDRSDPVRDRTSHRSALDRAPMTTVPEGAMMQTTDARAQRRRAGRSAPPRRR